MSPEIPIHAAPAVVLLSGGIDSATTLALARSRGFACHALTVDYGQRHRIELQAAAAVARHLGVASHRILRLDLAPLAPSALTADIPVPKDRLAADHLDTSPSAIPPTYVPARNTIFLALALAWAETLNSRDIFIGVNAVDFSGYPDCRPEFIQAFQHLATLATRAAVQGRPPTIHAPLLNMTKVQIIQLGLQLGVDFRLTHSCYDPDPSTGRPCRHCDACLLRQRAFQQLGLTDPLLTP